MIFKAKRKRKPDELYHGPALPLLLYVCTVNGQRSKTINNGIQTVLTGYSLGCKWLRSPISQEYSHGYA